MSEVQRENFEENSCSPTKQGNTSSAQMDGSEEEGARRRIKVKSFASISLFPKPDETEPSNLRSFRLHSCDSTLKSSNCSKSIRVSNRPMPVTPGRKLRLSEQLRKFRHFDSKFVRPKCSNKGSLSSNMSGVEMPTKSILNNNLKSATSETNTSSRMTAVHKLIKSARCRLSLLRRFRVSSIRNSKFGLSCERVFSSDYTRSTQHSSIQKKNNICTTSDSNGDRARFVRVRGKIPKCLEDASSNNTKKSTTLSLDTKVSEKNANCGRPTKLKQQLFLNSAVNKGRLVPRQVAGRVSENNCTKNAVGKIPWGSSAELSNFLAEDDVQCFSVNGSEMVSVTGNTSTNHESDPRTSDSPENINVSTRSSSHLKKNKNNLIRKKSASICNLRIKGNRCLRLSHEKKKKDDDDDDVIIIKDLLSDTVQKNQAVGGKLSYSLPLKNISFSESESSSLRNFRCVQSAPERPTSTSDQLGKDKGNAEKPASSLSGNVEPKATKTGSANITSNPNAIFSRSKHASISSSQRQLKMRDLKKARVSELRKYRNAPKIVCLSSDDESTSKDDGQGLTNTAISKISNASETERNKMLKATNHDISRNFSSPSNYTSHEKNGELVLNSTVPVHSSGISSHALVVTAGDSSAQESCLLSTVATELPILHCTDKSNGPALDDPGLPGTNDVHMLPISVSKRVLRSRDDCDHTTTESDSSSLTNQSKKVVTSSNKVKNRSRTSLNDGVCRRSHSSQVQQPQPNVKCRNSPPSKNQLILCRAETHCSSEKYNVQSAERRPALRQIENKRSPQKGNSHDVDSQYTRNLSNDMPISQRNYSSLNSSCTRRNPPNHHKLSSVSKPNSQGSSEYSTPNDDGVSMNQIQQTGCVNLFNGVEFIDCSKLKYESNSSQNKFDESCSQAVSNFSAETSNNLEETFKSPSTRRSSSEDCVIQHRFFSPVSPQSPNLCMEKQSFTHLVSKNGPRNLQSTDENSVSNSSCVTQSSDVSNNSLKKHGTVSSCSLRSFRLHRPYALDTNENRVASYETRKTLKTSLQSDGPDIIFESVVSAKTQTLI